MDAVGKDLGEDSAAQMLSVYWRLFSNCTTKMNDGSSSEAMQFQEIPKLTLRQQPYLPTSYCR
jgi:hypothetical protein